MPRKVPEDAGCVATTRPNVSVADCFPSSTTKKTFRSLEFGSASPHYECSGGARGLRSNFTRTIAR